MLGAHREPGPGHPGVEEHRDVELDAGRRRAGTSAGRRGRPAARSRRGSRPPPRRRARPPPGAEPARRPSRGWGRRRSCPPGGRGDAAPRRGPGRPRRRSPGAGRPRRPSGPSPPRGTGRRPPPRRLVAGRRTCSPRGGRGPGCPGLSRASRRPPARRRGRRGRPAWCRRREGRPGSPSGEPATRGRSRQGEVACPHAIRGQEDLRDRGGRRHRRGHRRAVPGRGRRRLRRRRRATADGVERCDVTDPAAVQRRHGRRGGPDGRPRRAAPTWPASTSSPRSTTSPSIAGSATWR